MESTQLQMDHVDRLLQLSRDGFAYDPTHHSAMLREITNHANKHLPDTLERTSSGSLPHRDSTPASSAPDARDSADRAPSAELEPVAETIQPAHTTHLIKAAAVATADPNPGKQNSLDSQLLVPARDALKQHDQPAHRIQSAAAQAHQSAPISQPSMGSRVDTSGHSSGSDSHLSEGSAEATAAAAAQLLGFSRPNGQAAEQPKSQVSKPSPILHTGQPRKQRAAQSQQIEVAQLAGSAPSLIAAPVIPPEVQCHDGFRGYQPPLSADPDNIAAWDTPRLEQLPMKLPEPRFNAHLASAALNFADPAGKADLAVPAYDSLHAAQARGSDSVVIEDSADGLWPAHVMVVCNSNVGKFLLVKQTMVCTCKLCQTKAAKMEVPFVDMTPTEFERHSGEKRQSTLRVGLSHQSIPASTMRQFCSLTAQCRMCSINVCCRSLSVCACYVCGDAARQSALNPLQFRSC